MTNINISPEAVEHLCAIHEGYEQHGTVATLRALSAALSARSDAPDTRVVTVAQLEWWASSMHHTFKSYKEIRAIIGSTEK